MATRSASSFTVTSSFVTSMPGATDCSAKVLSFPLLQLIQALVGIVRWKHG